MDLDLPPDIAQNVFQIAAMHECRYNFSLNSIKESWPELSLPGVHSDIGGGYNPNEQEYYFLTEPKNETVRDSVPPEITDVYRQTAAEIPDLRAFPNLSPVMASSEVKTETWYDYLVNHDKRRMDIIEKRVGAAVTLKRAVPNDWSKVSLRVMLDAAIDAGSVFNPIRKTNDDLRIHPELENLCQKAINQGKSVRGGDIPVHFSQAEIQLIGKYIHCSANWNPVEFKTVWLDGEHIRTIYGAIKATEVFGFINRPNPGWTRAVWNMKGGKA